MAHKRTFDDEVINEGSFKHQRQDGPNADVSICNYSFPLEYAPGKFHHIGESSIGKQELGSCEELENGSCHRVPGEVVEDVESGVLRSASLSQWTTGITIDQDEPPEEAAQLPSYPGYSSFDFPVRPVINPEDVYYCLLDYPPRKRIPVGPDYQAEIPNLKTRVNGTLADDLVTKEPRNSGGIVDGEVTGICVIPFPKTKPLPYNGKKIGCGRAECTCSDQGSVRCVRQHIEEARDQLRRTIGQDTFLELGFNDMGEVVADKWSEEEEQLFHEVVYSNPISLGKNFWNVLSTVYSSRTKMEIVSYYFNVFMLRKRAEQNRCDPLNIDSDNDECQGSDNGDEGGFSEENEYSGIESPVDHNVPEFYQNGLHLHEDEDEDEPEDDFDTTEEPQNYNSNNCDVSVQKPDVDSTFEVSGKKSDDDSENDVQDGSCTSSDSGAPAQEPRSKSDGCQEWNDYLIGSSDVKPWDGFSLSCPKHSVEFLSTCSMIEEVFGDGDIDAKSKRW